MPDYIIYHHVVDCGRIQTRRKTWMWSQQQDHHTAHISCYKIQLITRF